VRVDEPADFSAANYKLTRSSLKMDQFALLALMRPKPGKESELENFLLSARSMVFEEKGTNIWYAIRLGDGQYGIFDTFSDENGRDAHLRGEIARQLMAKAAELFAEPPVIHKLDVLASKTSE
jgi:quinol monooxygenase YgiN